MMEKDLKVLGVQLVLIVGIDLNKSLQEVLMDKDLI